MEQCTADMAMLILKVIGSNRKKSKFKVVRIFQKKQLWNYILIDNLTVNKKFLYILEKLQYIIEDIYDSRK